MIIYEQIFKKYGLSTTQQEILKIVGKKKVVLEIGASAGYMTKAFLENNCIVDVVETDVEAVSKIPQKVRKIFHKSIEDSEIYDQLGDYEFIILADVLEHLVDPEVVLKRLLKVASSTKLLISLPNIAGWAMRKQLFFSGDFEYQNSGLLDKTHLHFYSVNSLPKMLLTTGWKIDRMIGTITRLPLEGLISKSPILGFFYRRFLYKGLVSRFKNLAYQHFLIIASRR